MIWKDNLKLFFIQGVPHRNGKRHASEIGALSLDLRNIINQLEIPHLPGNRFKLRIGCHTGEYWEQFQIPY